MNQPAALDVIRTAFPICGDGSGAAGTYVWDLAEELGKQVPMRAAAPGTSPPRDVRCPGVEVFRHAVPSKPLSPLKPGCRAIFLRLAQ